MVTACVYIAMVVIRSGGWKVNNAVGMVEWSVWCGPSTALWLKLDFIPVIKLTERRGRAPGAGAIYIYNQFMTVNNIVMSLWTVGDFTRSLL